MDSALFAGLPPHYHDFCRWKEDIKVIGVDGDGNKQAYIPPHLLQEFWDLDRVNDVLTTYKLRLDAEAIRLRYPQVLSTLFCSSETGKPRVQYLQYFVESSTDDVHLPLSTQSLRRLADSVADSDEVPQPFPAGQDDSQRAWTDFDRHQWQFCPIRFTDGLTRIGKIRPKLDSRHIRPITIDKLLRNRSRGSPVLTKVSPHKASGLKEEFIVIKEYESDLDCEFATEYERYTEITNRIKQQAIDETHFLRRYGYFVQGDKGVILLEYAEEGSLLEFYGRNERPSDREELLSLLGSLSKLALALTILHNLQYDPVQPVRGAIHQDIKPGNIFVFKATEDSTNDYAYRFKLGDLGLCAATQTSLDGKPLVASLQGEKIYVAPELCQTDPTLNAINRYVSPAVDIWSLGAVLFEALVWMYSGERLRKKFFQMRVDETSRRTDLCNTGYGAAFHDGKQPLASLPQIRDTIQKKASIGHELLVDSMNWILEYMLLGKPNDRLSAEQVWYHLNDMLNNHCPEPSSNSYNHHHSPISITLNSSHPGQPSSSSSYSVRPVSHFAYPQEQIQGVPPNFQRHISPISGHGENIGPGPDHGDQPADVPEAPGARYAMGVKPSNVNHQSMPYRNTSTNGRRILQVAEHIGQERNDRQGRVPSSSEICCESNSSSEGRSSAARRDSRPKLVQRVSSYPPLTIGQVLTWIENLKQKKAGKLPMMEVALRLLEDRDQCFIVDNSTTMKPYWEDVQDTFHALAYLVKGVDPDGVELCFTSKPTWFDKQKHTKPLRNHFKNNRPRADSIGTPMEAVLDTCLHRVVEGAMKLRKDGNVHGMRSFMGRDSRSGRRPEGINVYILTDGVWQAKVSGEGREEAGGVDRSLRTIIKMLQQNGLPRTFLALQFIRFGDNPDGIRRLKYLDNELKTETDGWDIVDTRRHDEAAVWSMLVGPISESEDAVDNSFDGEGAGSTRGKDNGS